jgi:PAS domain S-box-containing protein
MPSIRSRIIGLLAALALPLIATLVFALASEYRTSMERAEGAALELAVATANGAMQTLDDGFAVLEELSRDSAILALDAPRCAPWLRQVEAILPQFANVVVADTTGIIACSAVPMQIPRPDVSERSWFQAVRATGQPATGRFQVGAITGNPVVVVAHPLWNSDGTLRGVVAAGINLERFQRLIRGLPLPPGAVVTLADDTWKVLARTADPERWIGQTLPGDTVPEREVAPGLGLMTATGLDGIERVFGYATVRKTNWRVYAGVPDTWIYAPVREAAVRRGIIVAGILGVVALLTLLLFRRVARSLTVLVEGTRAAALGAGVRVPETGPSEVRSVARQFNATLLSRERAENELHRARERYASVLRNALSGIFVATADGRFIDVNPALVRMLGYPTETALRSVGVRILFADPDRFDQLVRRASGGERVHGEECEWRRFDDGRVLVRLSCGIAVTPEDERVLEVIAEDVTERRALEEHLLQTRKMEAIGRLAGGVAHDFNNLLTIVRGQAQFLLMELGPDSPLQEHATEIVDATKRGARLTRQLLAFGRRQLVQPLPLDINEIVRNLETMLRRVAGEDIRFLVRPAEGLPAAMADPGQVEQIVMNLVFNARDAMPDGGELIVETAAASVDEEGSRGRAGARPGDFIVLAVSDTGEGIPAELVGRVFEPFFTTKPQGRGTGLGLATVYGIVTQSDGWIEVASEPGKGTRFMVYLPQASGAPVIPEEADAEPPAPGRGVLLVVEDEEAVRKVVVGTLRKGGYQVLEASSGEEALRMVSSHDGLIDLLVTDEMMPGIRGTELASLLLPERRVLRVLFMSGFTDRMPTGPTFAGAPSAFLSKPFAQEELLWIVARLLGREASLSLEGAAG